MHWPSPDSIISIARMMLLFNNRLEGQGLTEIQKTSKWRTASILSSSQSCIALSDKRLSSWVRIVAKCKVADICCHHPILRTTSEENKKTDASFYGLFIKMQTAEETYVHFATSTVRQPVKTFLIFRFPFGTEPIALLELEPDLTTCIW